MKKDIFWAGAGKDFYTDESRLVVSGKFIFKMVDQEGLPLEICVMELNDRNLSFDTSEFIQAAKDAGWKKERVLNMLESSGKVPEKAWILIQVFTDKIYSNGPK